MDPPPDPVALVKNPIRMMFDVVWYCVHIYLVVWNITVFIQLQGLSSLQLLSDLSELGSAQDQQNFELDDLTCTYYDYSLVTNNL